MRGCRGMAAELQRRLAAEAAERRAAVAAAAAAAAAPTVQCEAAHSSVKLQFTAVKIGAKSVVKRREEFRTVRRRCRLVP